ncbi:MULTISPECIES: hypothetical protein [unclassified Streptomyces]|uniref:hypothetical protein n=1 Tax=unclassified Streptomyces TaxID=2593676 RepID=UPI0032509BAF
MFSGTQDAYRPPQRQPAGQVPRTRQPVPYDVHTEIVGLDGPRKRPSHAPS